MGSTRRAQLGRVVTQREGGEEVLHLGSNGDEGNDEERNIPVLPVGSNDGSKRPKFINENRVVSINSLRYLGVLVNLR